MTPAQQRADAERDEAVNQLVAGFYASGGWTDERRTRVYHATGGWRVHVAAEPAENAA